jgi:hypothetical protein
MPSPLFTGTSTMVQNLPFVKRLHPCRSGGLGRRHGDSDWIHEAIGGRSCRAGGVAASCYPSVMLAAKWSRAAYTKGRAARFRCRSWVKTNNGKRQATEGAQLPIMERGESRET